MVLGVLKWWQDVYWNTVSHLKLVRGGADSYSLAMVEMTILTAAIYRKYRTKVKKGTEDVSPGITSRFEVFYDETKPRVKVRHFQSHGVWADLGKGARMLH